MFFSSDLRFYSKVEGDHFIDVADAVQVNPKFILLTFELPIILEKLNSMGINYKYTIYIADELNTLMRRYISDCGKEAIEKIEKSRWLMLSSVKEALDIALNGKNIQVDVLLTSRVEKMEKSIDDLFLKLLNESFRKEFLSKSQKEYAELVEYWKNLSGYEGKEFEKMILRDQVAYRAVMGEVIRKSGNPLIFSGQPPEPGDYFHGIIKKKVLPTMHVFRNVEGIDVISDIVNEADLNIHMKKFDKISFVDL